MKLLDRHPNWTMLLGIALTYFLIFAMVCVYDYGYIETYLPSLIVQCVIGFAGFVLLPAWNIRRKGRSFFNLFWLVLVPFLGAGWWIIMCLKMRR